MHAETHLPFSKHWNLQQNMLERSLFKQIKTYPSHNAPKLVIFINSFLKDATTQILELQVKEIVEIVSNLSYTLLG